MNMVTHMKTTVEISDTLLRAVKKRAREQSTTLRCCIETALKSFLDEGSPKRPHKMRDRTFRNGKGVQPGIDLSNWDQLRDLAYESREQ